MDSTPLLLLKIMLDSSVGSRCKYQYCKQRDFLPFKCQLCSLDYCTEHRTPDTHECRRELIAKKAAICPICSKTLPFSSNSNQDFIIAQHMENDCSFQPANKEKQKCGAPQCHQKLNLMNEYQCKNCKKRYCLNHRQPETHQCDEELGGDPCPMCQKRFSDQSVLINHVNSHFS